MPGYFLGLDTPLKKALFWGYVASWTVQGLAVHSALVHDGDAGANTLVDPDDEREEGLAYSGSSSGGRLMYNVTAMVILIEAVKLAASVTMYMKFDYKSEAGFLPENWQKVFLYYFAPATLYAIYNNMMHVILTRISPASYYLPLQLRLLTTAVVFSLVFKKIFSKQQWTALAIITFGCILKELAANTLSGSVGGDETIPIPVYFMLAFQIFASTSASVACEVLLKDFKHISTNMQNIFMYVTSIIVNHLAMVVLPGAGGGATKAEQGMSFHAFTGVLLNPLSLFICVNGAAGGILTGFLLANLSSVHKALALTIEIVLLSLLSSILFGTELGVIGVVSVFVVASGTFMYSGYAWEDLMRLLQGGRLPGLVKTSRQEKKPAAVAGGAQKQDMENAGTAEKGQLIS